MCYIFVEKTFFSGTIILQKKNRSKLSKNEPACMCKEGCCVGLGEEGGCLREVGGNYLKYVIREWNISLKWVEVNSNDNN